MSQDADADESDLVQLNVRVPRTVKEEANEKLPHGGLTRAVRDRIAEIAADRPQELDNLQEELADLRDQRRELAADLDQLDVDIERKERELLQLVKDEL